MHTIKNYLTYASIDIGDYKDLEPDRVLGSAKTDSRLVSPGDIFFALKGSSQNGEAYIPSALERGAGLVFASETCEYSSPNIIKVGDVYECFKTIVKARLHELGAKVIGITGSVGKTSTRNFCYHVLSEGFRVHKASGNYNTSTGIMMTVMDAPDETELMLLEMGVDTVGEMDELVSIAQPSIAVITNIGEAHLERLGSRRGIFKEKSCIFKKFNSESCLIIRGGDEFLDQIGQENFKIMRLYLSSLPDCAPGSVNCVVSDVKISLEGTVFCFSLGDESHTYRLRQIGAHMAFDASLAVMLGLHLGLSPHEIERGLLKTELEEMRFQLMEASYYTVINDCYNSSLMSLKASLQTALQIKRTRLIAVIGDILEIGEDPVLEHRKIGVELSKLGVDLIYFYGTNMRYAFEVYSSEARHFELSELEDLEEELKKELREGDLVLCKASRSLALERVVDFLMT